MTSAQSLHAELKTILHSKRANLYYLEHCRVLVNGGRVEYVTDQGSESLYWNIPIANTSCILLGSGTSITQAAVRELSKAGVMIGFCGGNGTPLFAGTEVVWLNPQSEYRPTEYLQRWCGFWFDDGKRLQAAKLFQAARLKQIETFWPQFVWKLNTDRLFGLLDEFQPQFQAAADHAALLTTEARLTKSLYALACKTTRYAAEFTRSERGNQSDPANSFLDHGNYLAYGLGATACWVLGLPHGLAVLHGKTRRGGLVFDTADIIKDALILPQAFIQAAAGETDREFRRLCVEELTRAAALDIMIDTLKHIGETLA